MFRPRIIPCLLLSEKVLVKTVKFDKPEYVGEPINAVRIFNDKCVDEIMFLDIDATVKGYPPGLDLIKQIASECFVPVCYGGGIKSVEEIKKIFNVGIEKISISSYAVVNPDFIRVASGEFGSQSIAVCIDAKKCAGGNYRVATHNAKKVSSINVIDFALRMEEMGAGELIVNSVDNDGLMNGYDIELVSSIAEKVSIPVVACGGAGSLQDIKNVLRCGRRKLVCVLW